MKPVFQTTFGYPTGNCFGAAVASVLELDRVPSIDPSLPNAAWVRAWSEFFTSHGLRWKNETIEPDGSNWDWHPDGFAIANVAVAEGIGHSIVFCDGIAVHDPAPGSPFLKLTGEQQRSFRILSFAWFEPLLDGETSTQHWEGADPIPNWEEAPHG